MCHEIPYSIAAGAIIGKGGETIADIQKTVGCGTDDVTM
jgi:hypothetical protein